MGAFMVTGCAVLWPPGSAHADLAEAESLFRQAKFDEGIAHLEDMALRGEPAAMDVLGRVLFRGVAVTRDTVRGCRMLERAAAAEIPTAEYAFAGCLVEGFGRERDIPAAIGSFVKAAEHGVHKGYCMAGNFYRQGADGVVRDGARAFELCLKGALAGDRDAQADVGTMYLSGDVVDQDTMEAAKWFQLAADQKQINATVYLGVLYMQGDGVQKNEQKALDLLAFAAKVGQAESYYMLGSFLMNRFATTPPEQRAQNDLQEGVFWLHLASKYDPDAQKKDAAAGILDRFKISPEKRLELDDFARDWFARNDCENPQANPEPEVCEAYEIIEIFPSS